MNILAKIYARFARTYFISTQYTIKMQENMSRIIFFRYDPYLGSTGAQVCPRISTWIRPWFWIYRIQVGSKSGITGLSGLCSTNPSNYFQQPGMRRWWEWSWILPGIWEDDFLAGPGGRSGLALLHRHQVADVGQHCFQVRHCQPRLFTAPRAGSYSRPVRNANAFS